MKKNILISIIFVLLFIIIGFLIKFKFDYDKHETENIKIDEYNFEQLEKAKSILENIPKDTKKLFTLKEFNKIYSTNITPVKNCYYINTSNGKEAYIFGFKLESDKYIRKYGTEYYAYPKYDLPVDYFCGGGKDCNDSVLLYFIYIISNPCNK